MRVGKKERAVLAVKKAVKAAVAIRASRVVFPSKEDMKAVGLFSAGLPSRPDKPVTSRRDWSYNGYTARRINKN